MPENRSIIKGLEQNRARFAYDCARNGSQLKKAGKYKAHAKKIAPLVLTNGLGQTLAFIKAKAKKDEAWELVYQHITGWLNEDDKSLVRIGNGQDLIERVITLDSPHYRAVTVEVLAFVKWLSRFADGLIEKEAEDDS